MLTTAPDAGLTTEATAAYLAAFSQPPYGEGPADGEAFAERVRRYAGERDGFRFVTARSDDGQLAGLCLAVLARPGDWWRDQVASTLHPAVGGRWLGDLCLEIVHVAVIPAAQRHGVGHLMHDVLIAGRPAPTGVLNCNPAAEPAKRFYLQHGWTAITRGAPAGAYWVMARDL